jgi:PTS system mannose-specific IIC component/fructoselysine and glucoselysine-specific PTS system IIC component
VSIPFYWEEIVLIVLLGGLLAVDERAGWQSMFSQPVISGATIGVILGDFVTGVSVGVVLELVWLSVLPMRGARRPDAVAGSIVGAGTACLLVKHTGDPRTMFIAALGAVLGLIAGEVAGVFGRRINRKRDRTIERFEVPADGRALQRRLLLYFFYSVCFVFAVEAVMVLVMLLPSVLLAEWVTGNFRRQFVTGAQWWINVVPTLGAGALVQMYWHKQHSRYLALCAGIVLILLWFK